MKDNRVLKIIASILFGFGVGICIGVATKSVLPGILVGVGLTICFAVSLNSSNKNNK